MTREEAISIMNVIVHMLEPKYDTDRIEDAVEMAISALSENKGDLISRKSLLNKINAYVVGSQDKEFICKLIKEMSSVESEEEWIPVTERLPKIADVYRVTRYYPNNVMNPKYIVDACAFNGSDAWYNDNRINHERAYVNNIIAWQENPEPYKARER